MIVHHKKELCVSAINVISSSKLDVSTEVYRHP
jgi:hypothetical protein